MATHAPERRAYTPQEAAYALGLGESRTRDLYKSGRLHSVRVGRRVLIPAAAIDRFLAGEQQQPAGHDRDR